MMSTTVTNPVDTVDDVSNTFQARFREAYRELVEREPGMNQAKFARDVEMSRANVSHWLNGRGSQPSADKANNAARRLGVKLDWLLRRAGPKYDTAAARERPQPSIDMTIEVDGVELTRQAFKVAKAFMDLPRNRRDEYERKIEAEALSHSSNTSDAEYSGKSPPAPLRSVAPPKKRTATTS